MKSIVTEYPKICCICGKTVEAEHHLIFGTAGRQLSEKDGLKIPICNNCHNTGKATMRIHGNPVAERLSKMLGQAIWERQWILEKEADMANDLAGELDFVEFDYGTEVIKTMQEARENFRKRYGRSYL